MARVLIVGEAPDLEEALRERGYAVRGTPAPATLGPLLAELQGVTVVCWLGGPALLESLAAKLVDTHVRGFVCEAAEAGVAERFAQTFRMPTAVIPDNGDWTAAAVAAVESIIR
jgi:hypothetical protein